MELFSRILGEGAPVLVMHGLFGMSDNLMALAKHLAATHQVHVLDLRNHGRSPHDPSMDYALMADDVIGYMDAQGLSQVHLFGHSMGGKVAMQIACQVPERVAALVVADIAPVAYEAHHDAVFEGLCALSVEQVTSRREADRALAAHIDAPGVRQFLLKNLDKGDDGFQWRFNLPALRANYAALSDAPHLEQSYEGPVLLIKGGNSDYIQRDHQPIIERFFPHAELKIIQGAGHWLHAEKPASFQRLVAGFLNEAESSANASTEGQA